MPTKETFEQSVEKAIRSLRRKDKKLAAVIKQVGKLGLPPKTPNSYHTLVHIIVGQQLSGKAAATIFGRVTALNGGKTLSPAVVKKLSEARLRGAGVSR